MTSQEQIENSLLNSDFCTIAKREGSKKTDRMDGWMDGWMVWMETPFSSSGQLCE